MEKVKKKRREKWNNQEYPPPTNPAPGICFCNCRLDKLNGVRRRLRRDWQLEDFRDLLEF